MDQRSKLKFILTTKHKGENENVPQVYSPQPSRYFYNYKIVFSIVKKKILETRRTACKRNQQSSCDVLCAVC